VAVTIWSTAMFGGAAIGPVLGGVLLDHFWWGSVFFVNVPVIVVALSAVALLVLPTVILVVPWLDRAVSNWPL